MFDAVAQEDWRRALEDRRVEEARRWGKQLWFVLDRAPHPLFHFGMAGGFKTPASTSIPAQVGAARGPRGVAAAVPEDPAAVRRRRRARDDRRTPPSGASCCGTIQSGNRRSRGSASTPCWQCRAPKRFSEADPLARRQREVAAARPVVRGGGRQLDRGRGALPGRRRSPAPRHVADRRRSTARSREARWRSPSARSTPTPTMRATRARGCSTCRWGKRADARTTRGDRIEHLTIGGRTTAWVPAAQH